jgi:hypothetical protein
MLPAPTRSGAELLNLGIGMKHAAHDDVINLEAR